MIYFFTSKKRQAGVTLLEMLITLAIAAILLTLVAPNVQSILTRNKIAAEINEMSGLLQFARYTAIDEQITTVVCPSNDFSGCVNDWNAPKMVFIDEDGNNARDVNEPLLLSSQAISSSNEMTSTINVVQFLDSGAAAAGTMIRICPNSKDVEFARALFVTLQGRTRISADNVNNDGIHEDLANANLTCP